MDKEILLTYSYREDNEKMRFAYEWFNEESELKDFIDDKKQSDIHFDIMDCIEILSLKELDYE